MKERTVKKQHLKETVRHHSVRKVELLTPEKSIIDDLKCNSIQKIATEVQKIAYEVGEQVYAIKTFIRDEGKYDGISSHRYKIYDEGTTYIGGEVMTVWQAKRTKHYKDIDKDRRLFPTGKWRSFDRIIITRAGTIERFRVNDRQINLPKQIK